MYFGSVSGVTDELILPDKFSFSIKGNRSVLYIFCLRGFCCVLFLIHYEYGISLNVDSQRGLLASDYFGNPNIMESVVSYLFVFGQCRFLLHICIFGFKIF